MPEPQATPQQTPASPPLVDPRELVKQVRAQFPEFSSLSDPVLLQKTLRDHPEWRSTGVPPNYRQQKLTQVTGANKAKTITGPRTWGESARENLPLIGAAVGSFAGGGPIGAGLAAATGEAGRQAIRRYQGLSAPQGIVSQATGAAEAGVEGAATEYLGTKVAAPVRKVLGGLYREGVQLGEGALARKAAETFQLPTTAAELAGRPTAISRQLSNSGYYGAGRKIAEAAQAEARSKVVDAIQTTLKKFDSSLVSGQGIVHAPEVAGRVTQDGLTLSHELFKGEDNRLYAEVDRALQAAVKKVPVTKQVASPLLGPDGKPLMRSVTTMENQGLQVRMTPIKAYVQRVAASVKDIAPTLKGLAGQDKSLLSFTEAVNKLPESVNFEQANALRSNLLSEIRKISDLLPGKYKGLEKQVESLLDRQMERTATSGGQDILKAWRRANQFHAQGARVFSDSIVADLVDKGTHAENVFSKLKGTQVTDAKALMDGFDRYAQHADPREKVALSKAKDTFRQGYLSSILGEAATTAGETPKLSGILSKYKPVLDIILANDPKATAVRENLNQLSAFMDRQAPVKGLSHWALFEALAGAGALVWGAHGSFETLAGAEAGPYVLAKILYSKPATAFLLDGVAKLPQGFDKAGPSLMRAVRMSLITGPHEEPLQ